MTYLRVAAVSVNQTPLDWEGNRTRITKALESVLTSGVTLACFPELCITGYGCEDLFASASFLKSAWKSLEDLVPFSHQISFAVGLPVQREGSVYNCVAFLAGGEIVGIVPKQYLANDGLHYEARWFRPWPEGETEMLRNGIPFGDLIFDCSGTRIAFEICEDAWVPGRPGNFFASRAVDVVLSPSASHFALGKRDVRLSYICEGSRSFGCAYVYANLLGCESGRVIFDGDTIIANAGEVLSSGARFSFDDFSATVQDVDLEKGRLYRRRLYALRDVPQASSEVISVGTVPLETEKRSSILIHPYLEDELISPLDTQLREFTSAVSLGLFDYMRKSRSRGFVISLSGGADSATVGTLAVCALQEAWSQLSEEQRFEKLGYLPKDIVQGELSAAISKLVTTVYQSTKQNSENTLLAAEKLAKGLGTTHFHCDVQLIVDSYKKLVEESLQRELSWETDDLALQNIQSRTRSPLAWFFTNVKGALLLTTGNRSESSVGYVTMDGDSSGGLNPIAGVSKEFIKSWIQWCSVHGPLEEVARRALGEIGAQVPTAELRPLEDSQSDEADLMPYPLLQAIEECLVRDKRSPVETYELLREQQFTPEKLSESELRGAIVRFFRMWGQSQWKRERFAPSFHLDEYSLDPRGWCRFPILSACFEQELRELEEDES